MSQVHPLRRCQYSTIIVQMQQIREMILMWRLSTCLVCTSCNTNQISTNFVSRALSVKPPVARILSGHDSFVCCSYAFQMGRVLTWRV